LGVVGRGFLPCSQAPAPDRPDKALPEDCLNILLIIARPYGEGDVGYHALAHSLVERVSESSRP